MGRVYEGSALFFSHTSILSNLQYSLHTLWTIEFEPITIVGLHTLKHTLGTLE